jgi:hypothetical protein
MRDLLKDWRHWSVMERLIVVALAATVALTAPVVVALAAAS